MVYKEIMEVYEIICMLVGTLSTFTSSNTDMYGIEAKILKIPVEMRQYVSLCILSVKYACRYKCANYHNGKQICLIILITDI